MAVAGNCTGNLASTVPPVNTVLATCGHRACKAFTGASAPLKSSLAGVAVVTRLRVPGPARFGCFWWPVYGTRHRADAMKSETGGFADLTCADMRRASSVMPGAEQGPDRKTAGLPFMANHAPMGRGLPSSRFDPPGPKHPRRGTMFPDGSGVPLRFTMENCHVCKSSNESATACRRAARRVGTRSRAAPAAAARGRPAAPCRGVRVPSSASRLVTRPDTRPTSPMVRKRCRSVGDLPTRGANRLPSGCRCARRPRSPPHVERQTLSGSAQGKALGR
jgi:hypothetical protein